MINEHQWNSTTVTSSSVYRGPSKVGWGGGLVGVNSRVKWKGKVVEQEDRCAKINKYDAHTLSRVYIHVLLSIPTEPTLPLLYEDQKIKKNVHGRDKCEHKWVYF